MDRRKFIASGMAAALVGASGQASAQATAAASSPFKLNYAPGFRHFRNSAGEDPIDQIRFMYDQGFRAIEDNGMMGRDPGLQSRIGDELGRLGMTMGVFVLGFGMNSYMLTSNQTGEKMKGPADKKAVREYIRETCRKGIETRKRVNAQWATVVLGGHNPNLEDGYQFNNVVENLKFACDELEASGLIMVLEPLNFMNHPGVFLKTVPQAYAICKAVNHPCCKILNDLYHQQIETGNLINNIDRAWDETVYIQVGDVPGRNEPTTGEIHYRNIFQHLYRKGYTGIVGMEHGISRKGVEGEQRLIAAYREVDDFPA